MPSQIVQNAMQIMKMDTPQGSNSVALASSRRALNAIHTVSASIRNKLFCYAGLGSLYSHRRRGATSRMTKTPRGLGTISQPPGTRNVRGQYADWGLVIFS